MYQLPMYLYTQCSCYAGLQRYADKDCWLGSELMISAIDNKCKTMHNPDECVGPLDFLILILEAIVKSQQALQRGSTEGSVRTKMTSLVSGCNHPILPDRKRHFTDTLPFPMKV